MRDGYVHCTLNKMKFYTSWWWFPKLKPQKYFFSRCATAAQIQMNASHWLEVNEKCMNTNGSRDLKKIFGMWPRPDNHFNFIIYMNRHNVWMHIRVRNPNHISRQCSLSLSLHLFRISLVVRVCDREFCRIIIIYSTNSDKWACGYDLLNAEDFSTIKQIYNCDEFRWA